MELQAVVARSVAAPAAEVFAHIVPIDLTTIFRGFGPLPAVVGVEDQTGSWDGAGQSRTVRLADGSTVREELLAVDAPYFFAYRIGDITGTLGTLAAGAAGQWWFTEAGGSTHVRWRYAFQPRTVWVVPTLAAVRVVWRMNMARALAECCAGWPSRVEPA